MTELAHSHFESGYSAAQTLLEQEVLRLNQEIVDRDTTIMLDGEHIQRLEQENVRLLTDLETAIDLVRTSQKQFSDLTVETERWRTMYTVAISYVPPALVDQCAAEIDRQLGAGQ